MEAVRAQDMSRMLAAIAVCAASAGLAVQAQEKRSATDFPLLVAEGATVQPVGELMVFERQPSAWFGNTFNAEAGNIGKDEDFSIVGAKEIASFNGPQIWVELQSDEGGGGACVQGCWAFLGERASPLVQVDDGSVAYGNFLFYKEMLPPGG